MNGSAPAESRLKEFKHFRCNDTYYNIDYEAGALDRCVHLINAIGTYVWDGAERELYFQFFMLF